MYILVVDDDKLQRFLCVEIISRLGHRAVGASNSTEAKKILLGELPNVVLTDNDMDRPCEGIEFARWLRMQDDYAGITIIMMSGYRKNEISLAVGDGAIDIFLQKPFDYNVLENALADIAAKKIVD